MKELEVQGIYDYELWPALLKKTRKESINAAHKQIVEYAIVAGWDKVVIAEDDIKFTNPLSWKYYLSNEPDDYDIYLSMVYLGDIDKNNCVKSFTGMTLYTVSKRFYEKFLSVNDDEHIDRALGGIGKFVVCNPFIAIQYNGWSSNTGKEEKYDNLLLNRVLYDGTNG